MHPLQTQSGIDAVLAPLLYVLGGLAFGGVSFLAADHDRFRPRQLVKTLVVYGLAGGIVYLQGGDLAEPEIVAATALAAPVGDKVVNAIFPPSAGGSPNKQFRSRPRRR